MTFAARREAVSDDGDARARRRRSMTSRAAGVMNASRRDGVSCRRRRVLLETSSASVDRRPSAVLMESCAARGSSAASYAGARVLVRWRGRSCRRRVSALCLRFRARVDPFADWRKGTARDAVMVRWPILYWASARSPTSRSRRPRPRSDADGARATARARPTDRRHNLAAVSRGGGGVSDDRAVDDSALEDGVAVRARRGPRERRTARGPLAMQQRELAREKSAVSGAFEEGARA